MEVCNNHTALIRIKALKDQIFEYKYRIEVSYTFYVTQWYQDAIKSLEKRIEFYSQFVK